MIIIHELPVPFLTNPFSPVLSTAQFCSEWRHHTPSTYVLNPLRTEHWQNSSKYVLQWLQKMAQLYSSNIIPWNGDSQQPTVSLPEGIFHYIPVSHQYCSLSHEISNYAISHHYHMCQYILLVGFMILHNSYFPYPSSIQYTVIIATQKKIEPCFQDGSSMMFPTSFPSFFDCSASFFLA